MAVRHVISISLAIGLFLGLQTTHAFAQEATEAERYHMGVGAPGSVPYNIGVGIGTVIKLVVTPNDGVDVSPVASEGYHQNLRQIIDGQTELAIVDSVSAEMAREGTGLFENQGLGDQLTAVATLWHDVDHFIIANDHAQSGTISDLAALSSENIATNLSSHQVARDVMGRFGAEIQDEGGSYWSEWGTPLEAFGRGEIAGFVISGPGPSSDVVDMLQKLDGRAQLLEFSRRQLAKIDDGWFAHTLTPDVYPGLATQIDTAARAIMLVARADTPDDAVYQVTKSIFENLPYLKNMDEAAMLISLDQAQQTLDLPLHPGAVRYYQETGGQQVASLDAAASATGAEDDPHANHGGDHTNHGGSDENAKHGDEHANHAAAGGEHANHAGHGGGGALDEHIHDEAMLSRARAEIHGEKEVLKIGRPAVLRHPDTEIFNVYFGLGQTDLTEKDVANLREVVGKIVGLHEDKGREPEVYVEGHTDRSGTWEINYEIAHRRAKAVQDMMVSEGVPPSWIHISDYSEQGLAVPTADGVQEERNRRVEITVIPQD